MQNMFGADHKNYNITHYAKINYLYLLNIVNYLHTSACCFDGVK